MRASHSTEFGVLFVEIFAWKRIWVFVAAAAAGVVVVLFSVHD